ncbi:MAG: transcriptional repressor [Clostridium sp.]|nr:transcriptional repressor [Clostridium sp.]
MSFEEILKNNNLKVTKGRRIILEILKEANKSLGAEVILKECKEKGVTINLSTVYRALEMFEQRGMVDKFIGNDGISSYKLKGKEHKHMLQCSVCHKQVEVPCPMKQVEEIVETETGFRLTEHNLIMKGVCEQCRHNGKS